MSAVEQFPYVDRNPTSGGFDLMPDLPIVLRHQTHSLSAVALVDSGVDQPVDKSRPGRRQSVLCQHAVGLAAGDDLSRREQGRRCCNSITLGDSIMKLQGKVGLGYDKIRDANLPARASQIVEEIHGGLRLGRRTADLLADSPLRRLSDLG